MSIDEARALIDRYEQTVIAIRSPYDPSESTADRQVRIDEHVQIYTELRDALTGE